MNIIITGASKGLGAETALHMAEKGNHTLVLISRDIKRLEALKDRIAAINPSTKCILLPADLLNDEDIKLVCDWISSEFSVIDILINNAGLLINKSFADLDKGDSHAMMKLNFMVPSLLIRAFIPLLKNSANAHVLNIGSMGGFQGSAKYPGLSVYSAAKGALAILTECLAVEYAASTIKFNCLALGSADTEMLRMAFPEYKAPLSARQMASYISDFALQGHTFFNGKILPVTLANP
jgi:short-subunit dehydrogenase